MVTTLTPASRARARVRASVRATARAARHLADLLTRGYVLECPQCGGHSAYAWEDVNEARGIAYIPSASGLGEWQCGHCRTYLVERSSMLRAECFTHVAPEDE